MGMFDSFYFAEGVLPNNKVPEDHEFQTKCLECSLDNFHVDADKNVVRKEMGADGDSDRTINSEPINDSAYVYSYEFLYDSEDLVTRKSLGSKYQEYKIVIVNSKLVFAEKVEEKGYDNE